MFDRPLRAFILALLAILLGAQVVGAVPPTPLTVYGSVKLDGENVSIGTEISAWCGGVQRSQTTAIDYGGVSSYVLTVNGDDTATPAIEGCTINEIVSFKVGALWATQTIPWQSTSQELNLTTWTASQPAAIIDLRPTIVSEQLRLDWTPVTEDVFGISITGVVYNIYRATDDPYFTPGTPAHGGIPDSWYTETELDVIGDTQHIYTYVVTPVDTIGREGELSNPVGTFAFGLVKGN